MWETIVVAARENRVVKIDYQKKTTGEIKTYWIEPYSQRGEYLFGHDRLEGHIKKFSIGNIINAEPTDEKFSPRWPVEL